MEFGIFNSPLKTLLLIFGILSLLVAGGVGAFSYDATGDGLTVAEEALIHGTDPFASDTDGDGLSDGAEINEYGTDPTKSDTDGDGLSDNMEVTKYGTDPTAADTTGNGISDYEAIHTYGIDPTTTDTDGDGLADAAEIHEYDTDPTVADTDDDGLSDSEEINTHGTDPSVADTDDDGLLDGPEVREYDTDPTIADTDSDNLTDGAEIHTYGTDPLASDTDSDGLPDDAELTEYETDPTDFDTDSDGLSDGSEVAGGKIDEQLFGELDPLQKDVLLEVDVMEGASISDKELQRVKQAFAEAPVDNPDESTGVDLHIVVSSTSVPYEDRTGVREYFKDEYQTQFDLSQQGYRHALIVNDARADGTNVRGVTLRESNGMIVQSETQAHETGPILMHELGHSLGLYQSTHSGIDSREVPLEKYPSIMNYNNFADCFGDQCQTLETPYLYSNGDASARDHDDWGVIEKRMSKNINSAKLTQTAIEYLRTHKLP